MNKFYLAFISILMNLSLYGTTITEVNWDSNTEIVEVILDQFPSGWGNWKFYLNGSEIDMEGGVGNIVVRPNGPLEASPTGLIIATDPWVTGLDDVDFPCCGTIQFYIPGNGYTNIFDYNFVDFDCETASSTKCQSSWVKHVGDIHILDGDTLIIQDTSYYQLGHIYVEDNAALIIRNSNLKISRGSAPTIHVYIFVAPDAYLLIDSSEVFPEDGLLCVMNRGHTEIMDSPTSIHYFDMADGATLIMKNSKLVFSIGGLLQVAGGSTYVENSTIGALGLRVPKDGHLTVDGLKSGTYFDDWDVHDIIPDADYSLTMKNSYVLEDDFEGELKHGPYERGWLFFLDPDSHVSISNSEIRKVFIDIVDDTVTFENLKIGIPSSLQYRDIWLNNVTMTGQWPFTIANSNLTLINSNYLFLQPTGTSTLNLTNSHICEFIPRDYTGTVNFDNGSWTIAGEFIGGSEYHSNFNEFLITGSLEIGDMLLTNLQWKNAKVTREFEVIIDDDICDSLVILANDSIYKETEGTYKWLFQFDETDYSNSKSFSLLKNGQIVVSDSFNFFTNTPILVSKNNILPSTPQLLTPAEALSDVPIPVTLIWANSDRAQTYELIVDDDIEFSTPVFSISDLTEESQRISMLDYNASYFWKVRAANFCGLSEWSEISSFTTLTNLNAFHPGQDKGISFYPIPVKDILWITGIENANTRIQIFSQEGKLMKELLEEGDCSIDFNVFGNGVYLLRLINDEYTINRKLIKL